jgi:hypothetical protein
MNVFHRHQPKVATDNTEALDIIVRLGVLDNLTQEFPLGDAHVLYHTIHGHPTHWILVARFHGFEKDDENGYMVATWPKAAYPASILDEKIAQFGSQPAFRRARILQAPKTSSN